MQKNKYIDVRSDTVTLPNREMMQAIMSAELGDDIPVSYTHLTLPTILLV